MLVSYDFFRAQRYHLKLSYLFYGLFVGAVALHAAVLFVLCWLLTLAFGYSDVLAYWLSSLALLALYLALGVVFGRKRVAQGGESVARQLRALRLFVSPAVETPSFGTQVLRVASSAELPSCYARFYEFAEQMSIASGLPLPKLYVLPFESAINACVAGFTTADTVLIVTQGALDKLSNEALYALIAHEFGHILYKDARLNLQIATLLTALSWFYECSEWLERWLLGEFHANYHQNRGASATDKFTWMGAWHEAQTAKTSTQHYQLSAMQLLFSTLLPVYVLLIILRLSGLIGMATHEWIVSRFNHERELLADATSVQLSRSFGIRELLTMLEQGAETRLRHHYLQFSHSFFAPSQATMFATHPSATSRRQALQAHRFEDFTSETLAHLDKVYLDKAYDVAVTHPPSVSLAEEWAVYEVAFESTKEAVVDGRLVVDKAFYDWQPIDVAPTPDKITINRERLADIVTADSLKSVHLPWVIEQHKRQAVGCLALIECTLLCAESRLYRAEADIETLDYKALSLEQIFTEQTNGRLLPHALDDELYDKLAKLARGYEGQLALSALRALHFHYNNQNVPLSVKAHEFLTSYRHALMQLLLLEQSRKLDQPSFRHIHELQANEYKLWQAGILALLCQKLSIDMPSAEYLPALFSSDSVALLKEVGGQANLFHIILLAFLVGLQDNSLLLGQTDARVSEIQRFCRLAGLPVLAPARLQQVWQLSYGCTSVDWALMLASSIPNNAVQKTLQSLLSMPVLTQYKADLLGVFDELWS